MITVNKHMKIFFSTLDDELLKEFNSNNIDTDADSYIERRIKEIARQFVEATNSKNSLSERLENLERHTHDITKEYGECDRMFYQCTTPVY